MSKSHVPKPYSDNEKVELTELLFFLENHGYSYSCVTDSNYILSQTEFVVISKEETATYKQVRKFLKDFNLSIDDFNMCLESSDNQKKYKEFIKKLEAEKKPDL